MAKQVFVSEDGKKFDTLEAAEAHEAMKANEGQFRSYIASVGDKRISRKKVMFLQGWETFKTMASPEIIA